MLELLSNRWRNIMKKRFHLLIIIGLLLVGFIIGSFFDLQIDKALFQENNGFGLFMASFGVYPCYICLSFIGGGLLCTTLRRKELPLWGKIVCYFLSALAYGLSIFLCGREWPSVNGHNVPQLAPLSYIICAIVFSGSFVLGYLACRKGDTKKLWGVCLVLGLAFAFSLIPAGYLIKLVIHRPRYRYMVYYGGDEFYRNWWDTFSEYKNFIGMDKIKAGLEITKEEFKSFPSGHSGAGIVLAMALPFLPQFFPKLKGKETLFFYAGILFGAVMMFSRLMVGAHFLTDTCMGSLIVMVIFYIANEIIIRKGYFDDSKETELEPLEA